MPPVGFEPTISAGERPQTYALDRAATGTGIPEVLHRNNVHANNIILINKIKKNALPINNQILYFLTLYIVYHGIIQFIFVNCKRM